MQQHLVKPAWWATKASSGLGSGPEFLLGTVGEAGECASTAPNTASVSSKAQLRVRVQGTKQGRGRKKANQRGGAGAYLEPAALDGVGSGLLAA